MQTPEDFSQPQSEICFIGWGVVIPHSPSHLFCPFVSLLHYTALSLSCATFISACIPSLRHHRHPSEVASLLEADTTMQCNLDEQLNLLYMLTYTRNGTTDAWMRVLTFSFHLFILRLWSRFSKIPKYVQYISLLDRVYCWRACCMWCTQIVIFY